MTATEELNQIMSDEVAKMTKEVLDEIEARQKFWDSLDWDLEEPWKIRLPKSGGVITGCTA